MDELKQRIENIITQYAEGAIFLEEAYNAIVFAFVEAGLIAEVTEIDASKLPPEA